MPKAPRRPPQLRGRVFRGSTAVSRGLLTRNDLRSSAWRPLFRDVYADAALPLTHRHRCTAVSRWLAPPGSAIAGRAAAALYGVGSLPLDGLIDVLVPADPPTTAPPAGGGIDPPTPTDAAAEAPAPPGRTDTLAATDPVSDVPALPGRAPATTGPSSDAPALPGRISAPIPTAPHAEPVGDVRTSCGAMAARRRRRAGARTGLRFHHGEIDDGDVHGRAGIAVTTPARTCWDVARWLDLVEAVVIIDGLLARRLTDVAGLREYALARAGRRGWRALLRAVDLADSGAESPQESRTRVRLVLAGLPRPRSQWVVTDRGRFVARLDLAWPEFKVAVEYDGVWHDDPEQFHRDRQRLNRLLGDDWIVLHLTARRLRDDFDGFAAEVRAALRTRGHRRGA